MIKIPLINALDNRLATQDEKLPLISFSKTQFGMMDVNLNKRNKTIKNVDEANNVNFQKTLSILKQTNDRVKLGNLKTHGDEPDKNHTKQSRKHKAILTDYSPVSQILHYAKIPTSYKIDYNDNLKSVTEKWSSEKFKRNQESNVFYIQFPPPLYTFMPGLGYILRSSIYSAATLKSNQPHLHQQLPSQIRPLPLPLPQPVYQQTVNPFIELPIDFVSNGKPVSVYQWQKKIDKKPADNPVTNLQDNLSNDFVSNSKPMSIYQWQLANSKPFKRPNDSLNSLNKGPYIFNGKLTNLYLLGLDGSSSMHQSIS